MDWHQLHQVKGRENRKRKQGFSYKIMSDNSMSDTEKTLKWTRDCKDIETVRWSSTWIISATQTIPCMARISHD